MTVSLEQADLTLAALVREMLPGTSWSKAKELCAGGRVQVNGGLTTDPARRLKAGERVEILAEKFIELLIRLCGVSAILFVFGIFFIQEIAQGIQFAVPKRPVLFYPIGYFT